MGKSGNAFLNVAIPELAHTVGREYALYGK
jgi:hypothetical protein